MLAFVFAFLLYVLIALERGGGYSIVVARDSMNLVSLLFSQGWCMWTVWSVPTWLWATQEADKINPCRSW